MVLRTNLDLRSYLRLICTREYCDWAKANDPDIPIAISRGGDPTKPLTMQFSSDAAATIWKLRWL